MSFYSFEDPSSLYSSRPQQPPSHPSFPKHPDLSYDGASAVTPSVEEMQSWFDSNYTMSPYNLTNQPVPSPYTFPQPAQPQYAYQQPPSNHSSSSSSGGSTFSSPQSYPAPFPSHLQQDGYFDPGVAYSSSSGSGSPPPPMSIDTSLLDGGMGYEAFRKLREARVECGFSGFFNCNSGMEMAETVGSLLRQPSFDSRRGSLASSEASYDSANSEPTPILSISPPTASYSSKRSHSPIVESQSTPRRVSSTSNSSSRKRVKLSPSSPIIASSSSSQLDHTSNHDLPPLPSDFDTFGPNGSSLFDDSPSSRSGRATTPDFSGRDDCWGIGREAYNKLSTKAKKQLRFVVLSLSLSLSTRPGFPLSTFSDLPPRFPSSHRNKIGARRFRERRKEYITTLEGKLAERDDLISDTRGRLQKSLQEVSSCE
ncbi:hypothetical protein BDY24DRAFT_25948 [Mrakia frigida]|uniref:uncharacterized protein n=1 Tax=Mrakia frigida TaxID=29902 RepID=UPI003FCC0D9F